MEPATATHRKGICRRLPNMTLIKGALAEFALSKGKATVTQHLI